MAAAPTDKKTSADGALHQAREQGPEANGPVDAPAIHVQQKRQLAEQLGQLRQQYAGQTRYLREMRQALEEAGARIDAFSNSLSWRLLDPPLRLLMRPRTMGRGETELDAARRRIMEACAPGRLPDEDAADAGPVFRLERSEWVTRGAFTTSIIVLNRDGQGHLEKLFSSYLQHHPAMGAEWIVVDHHSADRSRDVIRHFGVRLPITLVAFEHNNSFSYSNNFAALLAAGDDLVFCNNDIIFDEPVIAPLSEALRAPGVGQAGVHLYYPQKDGRTRSGKLQHAGIGFVYREAAEFACPKNLQMEVPGESRAEVAAVTGALCACRADDFLAVGGFDEGYNYGYEDVDLSLKIRRQLQKNVIVLRDVAAVHNESSSISRDDDGDAAQRRRANIRHFKARFGAWVEHKYLGREAPPEPAGSGGPPVQGAAGGRKVNVGCGAEHALQGWTNVDLDSFEGVDQVMDVTESWPFADVQYVYADRFMEHLSLPKAIAFLAHAGNALVDGGVIRLCTPNLQWVMDSHYAQPDELSSSARIEQVFRTNLAFHARGQQFLYDRDFLRHLLLEMGYSNLVFEPAGESTHAALCGLESRGAAQMNNGRSSLLIVEATRRQPITAPEGLLRAAQDRFVRHLEVGPA